MTELKEIFARYYEKVAEVRAKASPLAGVWGLGGDPKKHPCHDVFYEEVQAWVTRFEKTDPDGEAALGAVRCILEEAKHRENNPDVFWYLFAIHGLTLPLIPRLDPEDCRALFAWYDAAYPKRIRLPLQQKVWKLLKKCGK